jgi:methylated-DNA-protein-cysteine methyltransferase-like protein
MSAFNERVYILVRQIPPGKVLSYSRVAQLLGVPRGARAVGWALHELGNRSQPQAVPWQRVINAQGYISIKSIEHAATEQRALLEAEGVIFDDSGRVDMARFGWAASEWEALALISAGDAADSGLT